MKNGGRLGINLSSSVFHSSFFISKRARGGEPGEADPLHSSALLRAAPSGLTRFTTATCVGPLPVPHRGHHMFCCLHPSLALRAGLFRQLDGHFFNDDRLQWPAVAIVILLFELHRLHMYSTHHVQAFGQFPEYAEIAG